MRTISPYINASLTRSSDSVWLYFRFALSFRGVEEMLAMRGAATGAEPERKEMSH
jgi:hypothetical protein